MILKAEFDEAAIEKLIGAALEAQGYNVKTFTHAPLDRNVLWTAVISPLSDIATAAPALTDVAPPVEKAPKRTYTKKTWREGKTLEEIAAISTKNRETRAKNKAARFAQPAIEHRAPVTIAQPTNGYHKEEAAEVVASAANPLLG